jgi:predicted transcriptional regulator
LTIPAPYPHTGAVRFPEGALQRELDKRGMTQDEFAKVAATSSDTIWRACKGGNVRKANWSKILVALSVIPVLEAPEGLRVAL